MKATQKSAKSTTAKRSHEPFTAEERAAIKERVKETKAAADKADGESAVLAKIAEMQEADRAMGKRLHAVIKASAPTILPRLWYGMPAYAKDDKIICFFQPAQKFNDGAHLDEGTMWPSAFALTKLTAADEARIGALVKKAVS